MKEELHMKNPSAGTKELGHPQMPPPPSIGLLADVGTSEGLYSGVKHGPPLLPF